MSRLVHHAAILCLCANLVALFGCLGTETRDTDTDATTTAEITTFTPVCTVDTDCKGSPQTCVDGVCVFQPSVGQTAALTDPDQDNIITDKPIQLDCVGLAHDASLAGLPDVPTVTMWGRVDRFGGGVITADVEVAVFKLADFHPQACAGLTDPETSQACYRDDAKVGAPLAKVVSVDPTKAAESGMDLASLSAAGANCDKHLACPSGYECRKTVSETSKTCIPTHGIYALEGIPTNTALVVRVRGTKTGNKWHDSYLWDVTLYSDRLDTTGAATQPSKFVGKPTYRVNPTIVGDGQWQLVPNTIGLQPISEGNGVIGGRIRDCGTPGGRGGWPIHNAKIGLGVPAEGIAFFNASEDDTVPLKSSTATDVLGRYAAVDIPAGPNRLAASALIGDKIKSLGSMDVWIIPTALMLVSMPGRVPVLTK